MKLLRTVPEGESPGTLYRVAYYDIPTWTRIAAPFGLHWLIMLGRWLHQQSYRWCFTKLDKRLLEVREAGRQDGIAQERLRWQADPMGTMLRQWQEDADSKAERP